MRITHKDFRGEIGFNKIESPFIAVRLVAQALRNPWQLPGLTDLISISGLTTANCQDDSNRRIILGAISRGDWLMVRDEPLAPLSNDAHGLYAQITGQEHPVRFHGQATPETKGTIADDILRHTQDYRANKLAYLATQTNDYSD